MRVNACLQDLVCPEHCYCTLTLQMPHVDVVHTQVMLPLFCYCQLDNFAWGTRGIDAFEANGEERKDLPDKKSYEVCNMSPECCCSNTPQPAAVASCCDDLRC